MKKHGKNIIVALFILLCISIPTHLCAQLPRWVSAPWGSTLGIWSTAISLNNAYALGTAYTQAAPYFLPFATQYNPYLITPPKILTPVPTPIISPTLLIDYYEALFSLLFDGAPIPTVAPIYIRPTIINGTTVVLPNPTPPLLSVINPPTVIATPSTSTIPSTPFGTLILPPYLSISPPTTIVPTPLPIAPAPVISAIVI